MAASIPTLHDDLGDRYAIERELGHGATATVYLARDLKHNSRPVAIKILSADFALAVPSERFLREIRTTALLSHPHIVPFIDSDRTRDGRPFYVMRYIDGEVLRDRIAKGPFAIPEALRITRQAAGALGHAHRHGVIHRDIKPGNIMLEDGHTWVTDFGIARAMAKTDSQTVTNTGVTIGTPAYMSPEQVMGDGNLDGRSDIYSLGCVLYEMLAGKMPFDGPDIQAVMNKHLVEPLPPIRALRPDVPERVAQILDVALAKKRENRFQSAAEFAEALSLEGAGALTPTRTQPVRPGSERRQGIFWRPRTAVAAGVTLGVGVLVVAAWIITRPTLNPTRYFVAPGWEYEGVSASMNAGRLLQDALNEWKGIQVSGASSSAATGRSRALARNAEAGWYIRGGVSQVGDSLRVRAALYGTRRDSLVRERSVNLAPNLSGTDSAFARLADQLLFDDTVWAANGGRAGTRSVFARRAFARGLNAVQDWDLGLADSSFRQAAEQDPGYGQAHLWLAQVRYWQEGPPAAWQSSAERASAAKGAFSDRDSVLSDALFLLGRGAVPQACEAWEALTLHDAADFAGWYGLANCFKNDSIVIRDSRTPSGWRFRSSYHHALTAYQRAFQLVPSTHQAFRGSGYETLREVLMTRSFRRSGRALPPDSTRFLSQGIWQNDSLTFIPYSRTDWPNRRTRVTRDQNFVALQHRRRMFNEIATAWVAAFPRSAGALEVLAISLEMLGEPSSIDTLRKARSLETDPDERARLAEMEVWVRIKFSVPSDIRGTVAARTLADSILNERQASSPAESRLLSTLAALTGRAHLTASLSRAAAADLGATGPIAKTAPALLAYAALGGPEDSLRILERELRFAIDNVLPAAQRPTARMLWLARAAQLSFPFYHLESLTSLTGGGDPLVDAQAAFLRNDTASVSRMFATVKRVREPYSPADLTLDVLYPEAALLAELGDTAGAINWLDPTLNSLSGTEPQVFRDPPRAAALVQAMALRAGFAARAGDSTNAIRWARIVQILWSDADPFLKSRLQRLPDPHR